VALRHGKRHHPLLERTNLLSDEEWERLTNRDPDIIGQPLRLANETVTIVGVMPPKLGVGAGMWRAADPEWYSGNPVIFVNARYLSAFGRLAETVGDRGDREQLPGLLGRDRRREGPDGHQRQQGHQQQRDDLPPDRSSAKAHALP
jgi:hypothetical protein